MGGMLPQSRRMITDKQLEAFQGYVIYGSSIDVLVRKVLRYVKQCEKMIVDLKLQKFFENVCTTGANFVQIDSLNQYINFILSAESGKFVVFEVMPSARNVACIALIPINEYNKAIAAKLRSEFRNVSSE